MFNFCYNFLVGVLPVGLPPSKLLFTGVKIKSVSNISNQWRNIKIAYQSEPYKCIRAEYRKGFQLKTVAPHDIDVIHNIVHNLLWNYLEISPIIFSWISARIPTTILALLYKTPFVTNSKFFPGFRSELLLLNSSSENSFTNSSRNCFRNFSQ